MGEPADYVPPKVWTGNNANGGRFAKTNRPGAGPTHEKALPVGRHPLQLYSLGTPTASKSRSCSKSCWRWGIAAPNTTPG